MSHPAFLKGLIDQYTFGIDTMAQKITPEIEIALIQAASAFTVEFMRSFHCLYSENDSQNQKNRKIPQEFDERFIAMYFNNTLFALKDSYEADRPDF